MTLVEKIAKEPKTRYKAGDCLLPRNKEDRCCCQCIYRMKAAISRRAGDLGWAAIHARRWACLQPDLGVVTVFHMKDKGHGLCECYTTKEDEAKMRERLLESQRQAILADPSIIEVDTEAELPTIRRNERKDSDYNYKYYAFKDVCKDTQQDMKKAGWKKPKEKRNERKTNLL